MTAFAMCLAGCAVLLAGGDGGKAGQRLASIATTAGAAAAEARTRRGAGTSRHAAADASAHRDGFPGRLSTWEAYVGAALAVSVAASILHLGPPLIVLISVLTAFAMVLRERRGARRGREACAAAVPVACQVLAAELLAGALPADALTAAAEGAPQPLAEFLRTAAAADRLGASAALTLAGPPAGCEAMRAVAVCWEVSTGSGTGLAHSLEQLVVVLGAEIETRALVDAELAGVRLSALVMACLPVFGLALGMALRADPIGFLIGSPIGRLSLAAAVLLDVAGLCWVQRLGERAAR